MMSTSLIIAVLVFAVVSTGAFAGVMVRRRVSEQHLTDQTRSLVSVSMAMVATIAALVLGLLISNANRSFSNVQGQVISLSSEILRLDQLLRRYGPETKLARETLREYAEKKRADLFPKNPVTVNLANQSTYELLQNVEDLILAIKPANARDEWWRSQAMILASRIGETRFLLAQETMQGTPKAVLLLLMFWLTLLFASFTLFAPSNIISTATLTLCALAVAGAIGMILELEYAFGGLVHVSSQPMDRAVFILRADSNDQAQASPDEGVYRPGGDP